MTSFRGQSLTFWIKYGLKLTVMLVLSSLVYLLALMKKRQYEKDNLRDITILFLPPLGIGDLIMISPFVRILQKEFKGHKVKVLTHLPPLFEEINFVKFEGYLKAIETVKASDLIVSPTLCLRHSLFLPFSKLFIGYFSNCFVQSNFVKGGAQSRYDPKNDNYTDRAFTILRLLGIKNEDASFPIIKCHSPPISLPERYIVVSPYGKLKEKRLPVSKYVKLLKTIIDEFQIPIILIGSNQKDEVEFNKLIESKVKNNFIMNLTGKLNITEAAYVIKNSICFIGNDSGPAHLAYHLAPRSFVFFGAVNPSAIVPKGTKNKICVYFSNKCQYRPCYNGLIRPKCSKVYSCLGDIDIRSVIHDLKKLALR